jgi:hypothetical protein
MGPKLVKTITGRNCSGSTPSTPRPGPAFGRAAADNSAFDPPCRQKLCERTNPRKDTGRGYRCEILLVAWSFAKDTAVSRERDPRFESISLQRGVRRTPEL